VVDRAEGVVADPAAQHVQADVGPGGQRHRRGQRVGHHGQRPVDRQQVGQDLHGRAFVEVDRLGVVDQVGGGLGQPYLLVAHRAGPRGERSLEPDPLDRDRAAVHPPQQAVALQQVEVAPDRLDGHVELVGDGGDVEPARGPRPRHQPLPPLLRKHPPPQRPCPALPRPALPGPAR
jgi:hypothetical protein